MRKKCMKIVAIMLSITMLLTNLSLEVLAQTVPLEQMFVSKEEAIETTTAENDIETTVIGELVDKRESNIKHFRMSDGSITAAVYPNDVHYKDENGELVDIDNSLVEGKDGTDKVLTNQKNEFQVKFMKKSNKNKLYTLNKGKEKITVSLDGVSKVRAKVKTEVDDLEEIDDRFKLAHLGSTVIYKNIYKNVDAEYTVASKEIKENIILKKAVDFDSITYHYQFNNQFEMVQIDNKTIYIQNKTDGELLTAITAPLMWDAKGHQFDDLTLDIKDAKNGKATVELKWKKKVLEDAEYPVTIDPVMSFSVNKQEIQDTHILAGYPTTNYNVTNHIRVRNNGYALLQFPTPSLHCGDKIIHAELMLYPYGNFDNSLSIYTNENSYNPPLYINAHKILRSWDETTATYQNVNPDNGFYDSTVEAYRIVDGDDGFYTWDITRLANEWTEGYVENYGILLKYDQPPSDGSMFDSFFCSTNGKYISSSAWPQIIYQYINTNGLEDYLSYHSQDLGYAGTGHVNDLTGQLTVVTPLLEIGGGVMPISLSLIYNYDAHWGDTYGRFWNINWFQYIEKIESDMFSGVKYRDSDGTDHYFKYHSEDNNYVDEIDSNRVLTLNADTQEFKMTDSDNTTMYFKKRTTRNEWYFTKIEDAYGNYIIAELDSFYIFRVNRLYSSTGNEVNFEYNQSGFLIKIKYDDGNEQKVISIDYNTYVQEENRSIGKITFPDNTYIQYHYTEGTCDLTKVVDIDGSSYCYEFSDGTPQRIKKVTEYGCDNTMGHQMTMAYEPTATYVTDVTNGRKYLYTFAPTGTLKSVVDITSNDGNGYGQYYEFNNGNTSEIKGKNNLTFVSKTQKSTVNKLRNHSFENDLNLWSFYTDEQTTGTSSAQMTSSTDYFGSKSYQISRSSDCDATRTIAYQMFNIEMGKKYTLSAYVNTKDMTSQGKGVSVYVAGESFEFESEHITESKDKWQRVSVTFVSSITGPVRLCLSMQSASGSVYFDCVQFEEGDLSEYNLLENAGFEGPYGTIAEGWNVYPGENFLATNEHVGGNNSIKFNGGPDKSNEYQQVVYTTGNAGDTYVASAFAKAESVAASGFQFTLLVRFVQWGTITHTVAIPFNSYTTDWQKVSGVVTAPGYYTAIIFYLLYFDNSNTVYFDNAQLIKDTFGSTYTYDEDGNVISTVDLQGKEEYTFKYDGNNQLIKQNNISGGKILYSYDKDISTELSMVSSGGVSVRYTYDSKGNALSATTVGSDLIAGKYYYIQPVLFSKFVDLENNGTSNGTLINYDKSERNSYQRWKLIDNGDGTYGLSPEGAPGMLFSAKTSTLSDYSKVELYAEGDAPHQKLTFTKHHGNIYRINFATAPGFSVDGNETRGCYSYESHMGEYQQFAFILAEDEGTQEHPMMTSSATYSENGEYMTSITDNRGNVSNYTYNESRGYLLSETNANDVTTQYTYNGSELLSGVSVESGEETASVGYTYDGGKKLTNILSPSGNNYQFLYDTFGRNTSTKIGSRTLSENAFDNKGLLDSVTYGNGTTISYDYDEHNRQVAKYIDDTLRYEYVYDGSSRLIEVKDLLLNRKIKYEYDLVNRPVTEKVIDTTSMLVLSELKISYDDSKNRISGYTIKISGEEKKTNYIYGSGTLNPDLITGVKLNDSEILSYTYDGLNRLKTKTIGTTTPFVTEYGYLSGATSGTTTTLIDSVKNGNDTLTYTYDSIGNITSVSKNGTLIESYTYDYLNQLKTVTRGSDTYEYEYDNGGNILSVKCNDEVIKTYTYGDAEWKDLLTAYNGETITYDAIGNPLTYRGGMNFTWTDGRKLSNITKGTDSISYTYDASGLRNSKTINGTTTEYYWLDGALQGQKTGNESLFFLYDESGSVYGFTLKNETEESYYYYEFNLQGDIIGIIDSTGNKVVEYTYNEWGQLQTTTGTLADTIGQKNPLRYRGYYYDAETGFYYVSSRYYDPEVGRWLNADDMQYLGYNRTITSYNLFIYCVNNPIMYYDINGKWAVGIFGSANITLALGFSISAGIVFDDKGNIDFQWSYVCPGVDNTCGIGFADAGVGAAIQFVDVDTVYDLYGVSSYIGASGGAGWYVGVDVISLSEVNSYDAKIDGFQITSGYGVGIDIHVSQATTKPIGSNIINSTNIYYKKLTLKEKQMGGL